MAKRPNVATVQLKTRLKEPVRARLEKSAKQRGISLNAEMANRLQQSFDWDEAFGNAQKMLAEHREVMKRDIEAAMEAKGYRPVRIDQGTIWLEPGMPIGKLSRSVDAAVIVDAMVPELVGVVARAFQKLAVADNG